MALFAIGTYLCIACTNYVVQIANRYHLCLLVHNLVLSLMIRGLMHVRVNTPSVCFAVDHDSTLEPTEPTLHPQ
jgi:hypothetical protein